MENNRLLLEDDARVVEALRFAGFRVSSIDELVNTARPYPTAIPVLIKMLSEVRHPRIKEGIARALSVKEAVPVVGDLIREFRRMEPKTSDEAAAKWALGNAIAVAATDKHTGDVIELIRDNVHGRARMMLPLALTKATNTELVIDVLLDALNDEDVVCKSAEALAKLRASRAVTPLQSLSHHPNKDIQKAAAKALKKLAGRLQNVG